MSLYHAYHFLISDKEQEVWIAKLYDMGFESFIQEEDKIQAFISSTVWDAKRQKEIELLFEKEKISFHIEIHEPKDWNAEWESNFDPLIINDQLYVRALFHPQRNEFKEEILIQPRMAFGTGHHATTSMILEWMCGQEFAGKDVLDFGCGTGILGIYARLKNCASLTLIDNEEPAVENTIEHLKMNSIEANYVILGSWEDIPDLKYQLIFANITRNIILEALETLVSHLADSGILVLSGFLEDDIQIIEDGISKWGLQRIELRQKGDWICMVVEKDKKD